MQRSRLLLPVAALAAAGIAGLAAATPVYRWTDAQGTNHYGDRPPAVQHVAVKPPPLPAPDAPEPIARLRIEPGPGRNHAWADNLLGGPVEVRLRFQRQRNIVSDPALPARATLPAGGSLLLAVLSVAENGRGGGDFQLQMDTLPGDPAAQPRDVEYALPVRHPTLRIDQSYGGGFSHSDIQNRHAVDFAVPIGTPVFAARAGTVMQLESRYAASGLDAARYAGRANYIRIVHDDGTMAVYAHLKANGVLVRVGEKVRAGQQIGLSGNTGFTTGPHLHFVVQVNRGMRIESVPFRMRGPAGPLRIVPVR